MNCTYDCIYSFNCTPDDECRKHPKHVEYNLAEKNKYNCLKLHHVGYLIKWIDDARNHKYKILSVVK
jgi:hypothetical protein